MDKLAQKWRPEPVPTDPTVPKGKGEHGQHVEAAVRGLTKSQVHGSRRYTVDKAKEYGGKR